MDSLPGPWESRYPDDGKALLTRQIKEVLELYKNMAMLQVDSLSESDPPPDTLLMSYDGSEYIHEVRERGLDPFDAGNGCLLNKRRGLY